MAYICFLKKVELGKGGRREQGGRRREKGKEGREKGRWRWA
jgi:hypothetical protein